MHVCVCVAQTFQLLEVGVIMITGSINTRGQYFLCGADGRIESTSTEKRQQQ